MKFSSRVAFMAVILSAFSALFFPAFAYEIPEAVYPEVPEAGASAEAFVPAGWAIEVESRGDLNGDKRDDLLLVLKDADPANMMTNDDASPGMGEWDANPRILAIAFAAKKGGYSLVVKSDGFLPRHDDPCVDDPFAGAEIADGNVKIYLGFWANAGSWYTSSTSFTFCYRDSAFRLVSYSNYSTMRNTGESWDLKIDYITRKAEMTVGNFSSDDGEDEADDNTYTKALPRAPLMTFEDICFGGDFYPEQLNLSWWGISEDSEYDGESAEE